MRPPVTVLTRPPAWLGGGTHVRQMVDTVRAHGYDGDRVVVVGTLRGGAADLRLPAGLTNRLGDRALRAVGSLLWRGRCVHRISIDIPPARDEIVSFLDLAPLHFPDEGVLPRTLTDQARRARGVVVSTRTIADEVRSELGVERTWLLPPAVGDRFFTQHAPAAYSQRPYVLHVGGATTRKGLSSLAAAWPAVRANEPELELVMVGPAHQTGRDRLVSLDGVRWVGQLGDDAVQDLMAGARAVVVPSIYEGFGMPVAESLAMGTPVMVRAGTAPAEVGGAVAFSAASGHADDVAEAVLKASGAREREPERLALGVKLAQRWSVQETARMQMQVYREAFGS